jgi:pimeloyl-ACP methyl ester carboxylesterase
LESGHDTVAIDPNAVHVDYHRIRNALAADLRQASVPELEYLAALFRGPFLDDLSLPRCPDFEAWRTALVNEVELMQLRLRRTLIDRLTKNNPERALHHARALQSLTPDDRALAAEIEGLLESSRHALSRSAQAEESQPAAVNPRKILQDIRYCVAADGTRIAYALSGSGYPVLKCANWISHLQYEWESPVWRHWMEGLSAENRLVRYDQRGNGLSDWKVADLSFEAMVGDLESVADAAGLERFALLGISGGCPISAAYAARYPDRVSHLVLFGGRARGWRVTADPSEVVRRAAMVTLIRAGWGQDNPAFRRMFASLFVPDGTPEQIKWFDELQRRTISPENAAAWQEQSSTSMSWICSTAWPRQPSCFIARRMAPSRSNAGESLRPGLKERGLCRWRAAITFCFSMNLLFPSSSEKSGASSTADGVAESLARLTREKASCMPCG